MNRLSRRDALRFALGVPIVGVGPKPGVPVGRGLLVSTPGFHLATTQSVGPGDVFLVLGDSIAAGIGASDPLVRGFPPIVRGYLERLSGRPVELVNLAIPRETTTSFLANGQLADALRLIEDARGAGLRVGPIVVSLGANDLLDAGDDEDAREAAVPTVSDNLHRAVTSILAATGDNPSQPPADLIAVTYVDPSGSNPDRPGSNAWWIARLNLAIVEAVTRVGGRAVDLTSLFRGRESDLTWYPADIHPTNAGHTVIAHALWAATGYDTIPPSVTLLRPTTGALPRSMPTIVATAADLVGVEHVAALLDGVPLGDLTYHEETDAYLLLWDARALPPGDHLLEVVARDAAGNVGASSATVRPAPGPIGTSDATPIATGSETVRTHRPT